jgi:predicted RNase H-like nuclease (RuvC/YqgF family)
MKKSKKPGQVIADSSNQVEQVSELVEQLRAENQQLKLTLAVLEQSNTDLRANLADLRLLLGRSIETKEAQTLRQRLFRRNNQG